MSAGQKRLAILCRVLWDGGVQRTALAEGKALRELGVECDVLFLRRTRDATFQTGGSVKVLDWPPPGSGGIRSLSRFITGLYAGHRGADATVDLDLLWDARELFEKYDAVVCTDQYTGLIGLYEKLVRGKSYYLLLHEFYPHVDPHYWKAPLFAAADLYDMASIFLADRVFCTSRRNYVRVERAIGERATLARLGCEPASPLPSGGASGSSRMVLSVTQWDSGRHPELYAEVARRLPHLEFVLAGRWLDSHFKENFWTEFHDLPNLTITGQVSAAELEALYDRALLYMRFGYRESGPGIGGLDALSHGCITISNREIGLSELIVNGENGFLVDSLDPASICGLIERVRQLDPNRREEISKAALDTARTWSWEKHASTLLEGIGYLVRE